ncbi:hypothetical protein BpHYR1_006943 [Brachionus plicatilis]|uniref:Uncharacterized protein n=1 Tax=Brachionus plicatilis TaxID=10195 RepID=A0A3M7SGL8_BRAPC|nr:hypothetical protein BpHYR1_006943 [Brachionus plicatilis]
MNIKTMTKKKYCMPLFDTSKTKLEDMSCPTKLNGSTYSLMSGAFLLSPKPQKFDVLWSNKHLIGKKKCNIACPNVKNKK